MLHYRSFFCGLVCLVGLSVIDACGASRYDRMSAYVKQSASRVCGHTKAIFSGTKEGATPKEVFDRLWGLVGYAGLMTIGAGLNIKRYATSMLDAPHRAMYWAINDDIVKDAIRLGYNIKHINSRLSAHQWLDGSAQWIHAPWFSTPLVGVGLLACGGYISKEVLRVLRQKYQNDGSRTKREFFNGNRRLCFESLAVSLTPIIAGLEMLFLRSDSDVYTGFFPYYSHRYGAMHVPVLTMGALLAGWGLLIKWRLQKPLEDQKKRLERDSNLTSAAATTFFLYWASKMLCSHSEILCSCGAHNNRMSLGF